MAAGVDRDLPGAARDPVRRRAVPGRVQRRHARAGDEAPGGVCTGAGHQSPGHGR